MGNDFDDILGRMLTLKPLTKKEISERIKAEREAKDLTVSVRKMDKTGGKTAPSAETEGRGSSDS